jgi:hypothetical protein
MYFGKLLIYLIFFVLFIPKYSRIKDGQSVVFLKLKKSKVKRRSLATFMSQHFNDKEGWMFNEDDLELLI